MSFKLCCEKPERFEYSIYHDSISDKDKLTLAYLMWYLPGVKSYQSETETIFENPAYDDYLFDFFKRKMSLNDEDIKIVEDKKKEIETSDAEYYKDEICLNCQKIIFNKRKDKNKILELFKHIRNIIAHGCFNIVDDYFIGFDHYDDNPNHYSSVIKVKKQDLISVLFDFIKIKDTKTIFEFALKELNYMNIEENIIATDDLFVEKNGFKFWLTFKNYKGRYIKQEDIEVFINEKRYIDKTGWIFILVVDSTYTSSKINAYVVNEHIGIVDKEYVKEMLSGKDVLMEIANLYVL